MDNNSCGVCRLSVIPVRKEPSDRAELVTQLLFGEHYEVVAVAPDEKWLHVRMAVDQYEGWIDAKQHHPATREYFDYLGRAELKITTDLTSSMLYNKSPVMILMGSIIPISSTELFRMEEQFAFNGESKNLGQKRDEEFIRAAAMKLLNAPYLWGGRTPFGIDCSGFTQLVMRLAGYALPRDAWQQATSGRPVNENTAPQPADVAFFRNPEGRITHTGIVLPDNRIIHSSGRVRIDRLTAAGITAADSGVLTHTLSHFRRFLPE